MKRLLLRSREIEIDPIGRTLSRNGELTRPPRKVLDLILCLIRCREVVVTKEEIEREIWPGVRVSKASLRWLLKEVRSEEHTSNSSHMSISYAVFCLKKKKTTYL